MRSPELERIRHFRPPGHPGSPWRGGNFSRRLAGRRRTAISTWRPRGSNDPEVITSLVNIGLDPHKKNALGETAFESANDNEAVAETLYYLSVSAGSGHLLDMGHEGYNRDTVCYPTSSCFTADSPQDIPGYTWNYDVEGEWGPAYEIAVGRNLGKSGRLEMALRKESSELGEEFAGSSYLGRKK